ncbi:MAG: DUF3179 domain-containing protein [FCB group bacterium]|nr:DUF3179 domain-containing protein [FCB group bacterium]MBL7028136.1 DUF3179 domain-containing protein [Candidatus Neomarinimicrobiota bacterium]MBL7122924.1 DUF3179 domain-containing protein [Candidatus Neomarinimicrobiota bacterium]
MRFIVPLALTIFISGCQETNVTDDVSDLTWTIDTQFMRQGCYDGKDCIPSLEVPNKSQVDGSNLGYLDDQDLVVGIWNGSEHVAYPHAILDWHEIVNESGYSISYCPLTGSAIHLNTAVEYGVSGLLFNSNLIMYDRETDSYWPQMLLRSAAGDRSGGELHLNNLVETTWGNWRTLFPDTKVVNSDTKHSRNYNRYPYGSYRTCNSLACGDFIYFPVANEDDRLPPKNRVLTIINGDEVKALDINAYLNPQIIGVDVGDTHYKVVVSGRDNIAVAFETSRAISISSWDISVGEIILNQADTGKEWDITGQLIANSQPSERLVAANAYIAYWFSVVAFYPDVELVSP